MLRMGRRTLMKSFGDHRSASCDNAAVTFRCPLQEQELRFYRAQSLSTEVVQIELNQYPETLRVLPRET